MSEFFERISKLSPKRLALLALELQERVAKLEARVAEPIAVVGLGCRFPGRADSPDQYWTILREGIDAVAEVPSDRWNAEAIFDTNPNTRGRSVSKWGGFLHDVDRFDARFFGIARREAVGLDPQQRILLEVSWEALEHAGIAPDSLIASPAGVFVSVGGLDYYHRFVTAGLDRLDAYSVSGSAPSMAAGRLAYFLGLQGPALTVDTACSSSLVAVHLACQSLRSQECRMALAGASNLMLSPETTVGLSQAQMLSPSGRCRTFDAAADGIVRGEGCGIVVLKRLADARADGDRILALLRGTAINQDGRSSGITAPNGPAQEAVIREALMRSGLIPADIDYIEAHGTGTPLGDPIELQALANVFGGDRAGRLLIGSVKTNFGHLEMAAGVAGLMKVVLALNHDEIPPHLHFSDRSSYVDWDQTPVEVATSRTPWPRTERVRRAGVSSFGFSGTNAHVIVEEAPEPPAAHAGLDRPVHVLALSARDEVALKEFAARHHSNLEATPEAVADLCYTANSGRAHFGVRAAIVAETREEMLRALGEFGDPLNSSVWRGHALEGGRRPNVAFLFTGQGSQYAGMGRELYETQPVFRHAFDNCEERLSSYLDRPLRTIMFPAKEEEASAKVLLDDTTYTQPALFVLEYALAELWRSWGVHPSVVAGHSVGEYVAACVAGILNLDDALRLITLRARLMGSLPSGGAMASVFCAEDTALHLLGRLSGTVSVAAVNGPVHIVLSGASDALNVALNCLAQEGIRAHHLQVSHAFHSELIEPMLSEFEREASLITPASPEITLVSNVTGRQLSEAERLDGPYWRRHARTTVRFADSVRAIHDQGCRVMIEIGPHPVLTVMGTDCLPEKDILWVPSLRRGTSETRGMLSSLARLFTAGLRIDWRGFDRGFARRKVSVPTYPFQRESYWLPPAPTVSSIPVQHEAWRDWLYTDEWKLVADRNARGPAPTILADAIGALAPSLYEHHGARAYEALYPALDVLCSAYVRRAFEELGWSPAPNDCFNTAELQKRLGIAPGHQRLFERFLAILAEDGVLTRIGESWQVNGVPPAADPAGLGEDLLAQLPLCHAEINVTQACGLKLAEVLTGRKDPLEILFPAGSLEVAESLYEKAPSMRVFNNLVAETVARALQDDSSARILEIGAGTGATTAAVLPVAPPDVKYTFTDVSSAFINRARGRFSKYRNVEYRVLDIEVDPAQQGFASGQFDIIIASNVLHATARINETLSNVRSLLSPGGLLILVETIGRQRFGDLTVGLTPGWWRYADTDLRSDYALLNPLEWQRALSDAEFADSCIWPEPGAASVGIYANMALITARSKFAGAAEPAPAGPSWILFSDKQGVAGRLAEEIRARGNPCLIIGADAPWNSRDLAAFLEARTW